MIKSSKVALAFTNPGKRAEISLIIEEYKRVMNFFVDALWGEEKVASLISSDFTSQASSWLSARMIQCAGKQASGVVRGTRRKQEKRLYVINKLISEGKTNKARKLQRIYDEASVSKPKLDRVEIELDPRFVKVSFDRNNSFDGWVKLKSLGIEEKLHLPFKRTKHFNKLESKGVRTNGLRLSNSYMTFMFEIPDPPKKDTGSTVGVDVGIKNAITVSNGFSSREDNHGHTLDSIIKKISNKKKGSKAFARATKHRTNYVNWTINQLDLSDVKQVNIENIKHLRRSVRTNRGLSHWTYTEIFGKLETTCLEQGVLVKKVVSTYTSQRCSHCGWTRKTNRKGKQFKCAACGYAADADLNASINISLPLKPIGKKQRLKQPNRTGFYWLVSGQEPIVPVVQKTKRKDFHDF